MPTAYNDNISVLFKERLHAVIRQPDFQNERHITTKNQHIYNIICVSCLPYAIYLPIVQQTVKSVQESAKNETYTTDPEVSLFSTLKAREKVNNNDELQIATGQGDKNSNQNKVSLQHVEKTPKTIPFHDAVSPVAGTNQ